MSKISPVLIVGKVPPPAGGVGVHVQRLIGALERKDVPFYFFDMRAEKWWWLPTNLFKNRIIHLHVSNSYVRFAIVILAKLFRNKLMFTFHGNVGRYGKFRNLIDRCSFRLSNQSIVLNPQSFELASKVSKRVNLIPAYIWPVKIEPLSSDTLARLNQLKSVSTHVFCTNANSALWDSDGHEVYGILDLIKIFQTTPDLGLVFSDASGEYSKLLKDREIQVPENMLILNDQHDFVSVIQATEGLIRATSTDGDSLSVREALDFGKSVIASDSVPRPENCILYAMGDNDALREKIVSFQPSFVSTSNTPNAVDLIIDLYTELSN